MRHLTTGEQRYVGNVGSFAFDDAGKLMAYTVRGQQRLGNGVYVMTLATGEQRMLDAATADYDQLTWSAEGHEPRRAPRRQGARQGAEGQRPSRVANVGDAAR